PKRQPLIPSEHIFLASSSVKRRRKARGQFGTLCFYGQPIGTNVEQEKGVEYENESKPKNRYNKYIFSKKELTESSKSVKRSCEVRNGMSTEIVTFTFHVCIVRYGMSTEILTLTFHVCIVREGVKLDVSEYEVEMYTFWSLGHLQKSLYLSSKLDIRSEVWPPDDLHIS
ncbi:hypothetical protein STEG23_004487, partial [Scotinomys teguina]